MQHVHIWVLLEDVGLGVVLEVAVVPPVCRGTLEVNKDFSSVDSCSQGGITQSFIGTKVIVAKVGFALERAASREWWSCWLL